jgi:hypothetical protein
MDQTEHLKPMLCLGLVHSRQTEHLNRGGQILLLDFDFEINFPKPCHHVEFLSICKCTEQSLFQILVNFPNCFGKLTLGKQLNWIRKSDFWPAGAKISP